MRLFFALWPDDAAQADLASATRNVVLESGGRPVLPRNYHVTLAFIGSVPEKRLADVGAAAEHVSRDFAGSSVELTFDGIEYWKKAGVVCATESAASPAAAGLAEALKSRLVAASFTPDLKPFRTHVTLARKVARAPGAMHGHHAFSLVWKFAQFALAESRTESDGAVYRLIGSWPIALSAPSPPLLEPTC
jgi:RNA 2',3'-cyclic 3'-phosphodiesterase